MPMRRIAFIVTMMSLLTVDVSKAVASSRDFDVSRYGARCDDVSDDTAAFQAAFDAAGARCKAAGAYVVAGFAEVVVPDGAICKITRKLTNSKSDCVGLVSFAGATLDFRALANGATALEQKRMASGAYSGNIPRFENMELIGPGRSSETVAIDSQTANTSYRQFNVHGFGHGYEIHNGGWLNHFVNTSISDCAIDIYCASGLKDAGELISFQGGVLFNSGEGVENDGCELNITDSSLDEFNGPAIVNGGGTTRLTADHIEYVNSTTSAPLVVSSKACNAWSSITMTDGQIQFDHAAPKALASNDGGPGPCGGGGWGAYIRINNVFLGNIPMDSNDAPVVTGTNSSQIAVCNATKGNGGGAMGNVRNIGRPYFANQGQCP
jgi:hypothetical protein